MKPVLSVIIPVYNVENYLERCVKSVLNQDYQELEVILVDDGSPDNCPQICDELAKIDKRIIVVHKPNGGLSSARNVGLNICTGEYVTFLDSDDQWAECTLNIIMKYAVEAQTDMIMFASISLYPDGMLRKRDYGNLGGDKFEVFPVENLYKKLTQNGDLREQAGTHIIRTSFLKENRYTFKQGILCEDTEFMFRILRNLNSIAVTDKVLLIYTEQRIGSITNTVSIKRLNDLVDVIQNSLDYYKNNNNKIENYEKAHCAYLWSIALGYCSLIEKNQSKRYLQKLRCQKKYLNLFLHPKSKKVGYLCSVFGMTLTSRFLAVYIKLRNRNILKFKQSANG